MQEVDLEQYEPYFVETLQSLGYDHIFLAAKKKRQGLLIAWKSDKYYLNHRKDVHYDRLDAGTVGPTMWTGNIGLVLGLKDKEMDGRGLWVTNTHLFWHPRGSYERQRQAGVLVSETIAFSSREPTWPTIICGGTIFLNFWLMKDFNSTPRGMTYTALTQRPIQLTPYQQDELEQSVAYDFRKVKEEEEDLADDSDVPLSGTETPADKDSDIDADSSPSLPVWKTSEYLKQALLANEEKPLNIMSATLENNQRVLDHHALNPPLISLYSTGLKLCQPDNVVNSFGEPPFTNWAQGYRETLDYIFVVNKGQGTDGVKLTGLLQMPKREEMGEGEPQEGRFPSDHVCEMAEIELL